MATKILSVVVNEEFHDNFYKKFTELQDYAKEKKYTKARVMFLMEELLTPENLAKVDLENCCKK